MSADLKQLISVHGLRVGLNAAGGLLLDGHLKVPSWKDPGVMVRQFDHFTGPVMNPNLWASVKGSDGACVFFAVHADKGGKLRGTFGAGANTMAINGSELTGELNWDTGKGAFSFAATAQLSDIAHTVLFVGMTDKKTLECPFTMSVVTLTSNASNGFGFLYDNRATVANWKCVGVAADVDAGIIDTGSPPVAATDDLFVMESDALGTVTFYLNGKAIGTTPGCCTPGTALCPVIAGFTTTGVSQTVDTDFLSVEQSR